uniref:D-lactate dehydratase n=1 Tax=Parastrongyloides trichosuri TaxID=131310 RepID=A0A0N4ZR77_PARTI
MVSSDNLPKNHRIAEKFPGTSTALIIASHGSEDIELVTSIDVLRRCGVEVTVASLQDSETIKCTNGTEIKVDVKLSDVKTKLFHAIVLPGGGPGSKAFCESSTVGEILKAHEKDERIIAAICAAPTAISAHKISPGCNLTSYPCFSQQLIDNGYKYSEDRVVVHNERIITSRGPATAMEFAFVVSDYLVGEVKVNEVKKAMLII